MMVWEVSIGRIGNPASSHGAAVRRARRHLDCDNSSMNSG